MNEIDELEAELDVIYDRILSKLGDIPDCTSKEMLIDMLSFQNKSTRFLIKLIAKNMETTCDNSIHSVSISEGS
jgi:hypothetical protein